MWLGLWSRFDAKVNLNTEAALEEDDKTSPVCSCLAVPSSYRNMKLLSTKCGVHSREKSSCQSTRYPLWSTVTSVKAPWVRVAHMPEHRVKPRGQ